MKFNESLLIEYCKAFDIKLNIVHLNKITNINIIPEQTLVVLMYKKEDIDVLGYIELNDNTLEYANCVRKNNKLYVHSIPNSNFYLYFISIPRYVDSNTTRSDIFIYDFRKRKYDIWVIKTCDLVSFFDDFDYMLYLDELNELLNIFTERNLITSELAVGSDIIYALQTIIKNGDVNERFIK